LERIQKFVLPETEITAEKYGTGSTLHVEDGKSFQVFVDPTTGLYEPSGKLLVQLEALGQRNQRIGEPTHRYAY